MTFKILPDTFSAGSTRRTTLTVVNPSATFSLKSFLLTSQATYAPTVGPSSTWTVTQIGQNSDTQASLQFAVPAMPDNELVIGSSGTLTVTGTSGANTMPIPVPCSES